MSILTTETASTLPDKSLRVLYKRNLSAGARIVTRYAALGADTRLFARGFRGGEEFLGLLEGLREISETF